MFISDCFYCLYPAFSVFFAVLNCFIFAIVHNLFFIHRRKFNNRRVVYMFCSISVSAYCINRTCRALNIVEKERFEHLYTAY